MRVAGSRVKLTHGLAAPRRLDLLSAVTTKSLSLHVAEVLPQPFGIEMMGQTGKAQLWRLPSFGGYPL
jgi:hypothetical protein